MDIVLIQYVEALVFYKQTNLKKRDGIFRRMPNCRGILWDL